MALPDAAALDRIHMLLQSRRSGLIDDAQLIEAIETAVMATGREYVHDAPGPEPVPFIRRSHLRLVGKIDTADGAVHLSDDEAS